MQDIQKAWENKFVIAVTLNYQHIWYKVSIYLFQLQNITRFVCERKTQITNLSHFSLILNWSETRPDSKRKKRAHRRLVSCQKLSVYSHLLWHHCIEPCKISFRVAQSSVKWQTIPSPLQFRHLFFFHNELWLLRCFSVNSSHFLNRWAA